MTMTIGSRIIELSEPTMSYIGEPLRWMGLAGPVLLPFERRRAAAVSPPRLRSTTPYAWSVRRQRRLSPEDRQRTSSLLMVGYPASRANIAGHFDYLRK